MEIVTELEDEIRGGAVTNAMKMRLKFAAKVNMGQSPSSEDCNKDNQGMPFLQGNAEFKGMPPQAVQFCLEPPKISAKNTILLSVRAPVGAINIADQDYGIGRGLCGITVNAKYSNTKFLYYLLLAKRHQLNKIATGSTYQAVSSEDVSNLELVFPQIDSQKSIACFLDLKTAVIDTLIAKKQRLIQLLEEKRTALIDRAVTIGLNPIAPMKESNSLFFNLIPKHWMITRLKFIVTDVADSPHFSPQYVQKGQGIMFISARNIKVDKWSFEDAKYISDDLYREFCKRITPQKGDVLYTKGGTTGVARHVDFDEPFHVWVHVAVLKILKKLILPKYLEFVLNSLGCYDQSQLYTRGATNNDLGLTRIVNIELPLPSLSEQAEAIAFLEFETDKIVLIKEKIQAQIEKLQEYRRSLITAAVTGKLEISEVESDV